MCSNVDYSGMTEAPREIYLLFTCFKTRKTHWSWRWRYFPWRERRSLAMEICRPKGNNCARRGSFRYRISHPDTFLVVLLLARWILCHCESVAVVASFLILHVVLVLEQQWRLVNSRLHHQRPVLRRFPLQSRKMNCHHKHTPAQTISRQLLCIALAWCSIAYNRIDWQSPYFLEVAGCSRSLRGHLWPCWYLMAEETE